MMMDPIRSDLVISAPQRLVWGALADLEGVSTWHPAVDEAECLSDHRSGLGARRRCAMRPSGWLVESVCEWDPPRSIAFKVEDAPPLRSGVGHFELDEAPTGTRLRGGFDYEVRFGPLGPVIDRLLVHRQLRSAWSEGIQGLRRYVEDERRIRL